MGRIFIPGDLDVYFYGGNPAGFLWQLLNDDKTLAKLISQDLAHPPNMSQRASLSLGEWLNFILPILTTGFAYGWENGSLGGILAMPRKRYAQDTPGDY